MKTFKKEISFLLIAAMVISSIIIGVGTVTVQAFDQASGQLGYYRFEVYTNCSNCCESGTSNNCTVTINYYDGSNWSYTILADSNPSHFKTDMTDNITLGPAPAKPISSISITTTGGDTWGTDWANFYYSYDNGTSWFRIATMGGFNMSNGTRNFTYPTEYSLNSSSLNKTLTFDANGGTGGKQLYSEYGATLPASNIPTVTRTGYTFAGWSPAVPAYGPAADTTFTAQWTPNNVSITFDANGGTGGTGPTSMQVGSSLTPPTVGRTGYTFLTWLPEVPATVPVIDTTYTAQWVENPTMTFISNGGSEVNAITSAYNASVLRPADPVKDGYNFGEWFLEAEFITPVLWPFTVTHDTNLYAKWNAGNQYTIIFDANSGTGGASAVWLAGDSLTAPAVAKTGYTLTGWSPVLPATVPAVNTIYIAQWSANTYTVSYDGNGNDAGSTASSLHTYDTASNLTANGFTKVGHSLSGWSADAGAAAPAYTNGQSVLNLTPNQGEVITFYAVWSTNYYTITFNASGGNGGTSTLKQYGAALTAPTVTKTGYTFTGWSPAVPATVPAGNTTYTAQWTANQYLVTFDPQGGSVSPTSSTVTYGSTYGAGTGGFPTPTRTGYMFGGWYTGANGSGSNRLSTTTVTTNAAHTLYAKWTGISYTVAYNGNGSTGGSTANSTHTYGTAKTLTANGYTNTGYAFAGWATSAGGDVVYSDKQSVLNLTETTGATVTLYAKWTNVNVSTVTFDANGGTGGTSTMLIIGAPLTAPTVTRTGYTFLSWSPTVPATVPAENTTYTAQWTARIFTVTFEPANSGTVSPTTSIVTYDSTYGAGTGGFPTPTRAGNTFGGWFTQNGGVGIQIFSTTVVTRTTSHTLYAYWPNPTVIITFDANGGSGSMSPIQVPEGTNVTLPHCTMTRTGYIFTGWGHYPTGSAFWDDGNTITVMSTFTLYAVWTANTYTVNFDAQGGSVSPATKTVTYAGTYGTLPTPTRTGFTFGGWYTSTGGTGTNILSTTTVSLTAAQTLYAKWTAGTVNITFDANDGTGGTSASLAIGAVLTAPTVTRTGYIFAGWSPAVPPVVPDVSTTYTAQWTANTYTVTFDAQGGTVSPVSSTITYNGTYGAGTGGFPAPERTGYTFGGWYTGTNGAGAQILSTTTVTITASQTLYAKWTETATTVTITFDANGGNGGTSTTMTIGATLTAPRVSKPGYVFAGWTPAVPSTVPAENTAYTAQWTKTDVSITKLAEGFKVNIQGWSATNKYQIWSYQSITSDLFNSETASQWMLSKPYALGSDGTLEDDGSISYTIADFVSPDSNYTIAVRIMCPCGRYVDEIRDSYTPADVSEVKIAKVLVDGEYSSGREIREIKAGAAMTFTVVGNNVPGTVFTAKVLESGTPLTANSAAEFSWNISALTPGTYTVQFVTSNGATWDTRSISVQLYSLDTGIQYGNISSLGLTAIEDNALPKTLTIDPDFTNGSFYYRVAEPGRKAIFTSGLFQQADSIEYTFIKYGVYQVAGFVNREYEVKIGGYYDDGFIKQFTVNRSQTEPSSVELAANADITKPVDKATPLLFTASADIGGIGSTPVEYSFWRYDAKGYVLVKDWSSDNTLDWTPARVGIYTLQVRAKGADAGSYEAAKSVQVTVTDATDQIAQGVVITLNEVELNANATARAPITIKASATSTNSEDLLYKFNIGDSAMGIETVQNYSADSNCVWTPRKAGTYTISVLVKNQTSFGAYDAMETFEIARVKGGDQG